MGLKKALLVTGGAKFVKSLGKGNFSTKKLLSVAIIGFVALIVGFIILVIITVAAARWAWNAGNAAVQQNPTVSSVVETTKQEASQLLPSVPSSANDFITNNQVDTAKLTDTYTNLPAQTQEVWKAAMEKSIAQAIEGATGTSVATLQQLRDAVLAL